MARTTETPFIRPCFIISSLSTERDSHMFRGGPFQTIQKKMIAREPEWLKMPSPIMDNADRFALLLPLLRLKPSLRLKLLQLGAVRLDDPEIGPDFALGRE